MIRIKVVERRPGYCRQAMVSGKWGVIYGWAGSLGYEVSIRATIIDPKLAPGMAEALVKMGEWVQSEEQAQREKRTK